MGREALREDAVYGVGPTIFVADDFIGDVCHMRASVACVMRNVGREAEDIIANRQIAGEVPGHGAPVGGRGGGSDEL